jgi:hypothetical protein
LTDAVKYLKAWTDAEIKEGGVFRRFTPRGTTGQTAIAPQEVARIIQSVGRAANAKAGYGAMAWPASHLSATPRESAPHMTWRPMASTSPA